MKLIQKLIKDMQFVITYILEIENTDDKGIGESII